MNDFADKALPLALQGYPVFPCIPSGEDAKRPLTLNGFKDATTDIAQIAAWATVWPQALVGVPTGKASGLAVVDLDVKVSADGEIVADGFATLAALSEQLPPTRTHKTKRGEHRLYRTNGAPLKCTTGAIGPGIDTRGEGGYIIWWPAEGLAVEGDELLPLPEWVISATAKPEQPEQSKAQSKQPGTGSRLCTLEQLPELLAHLDPDMQRFGNGEGWIVAGMGIKQAFGEAGYPAWLEWSKRGEKFKNERECKQQWKSFKDKPDGFGFGSVVDMAVAGGWKPAPPDVPAGMFSPVQPDDLPEWDDTPNGQEAYQALPQPPFPGPFPGPMADLFNAALPLSYKEQPELLTLGLLLGMSASISGRYFFGNDVRCNLYGIGILETGQGKDMPRLAGNMLAREGNATVTDMPASGEGLEDLLSDYKSILMSVDEIGHMFAATNAEKVQSHLIKLKREILRLFSASRTYVDGRPKAGIPGRHIHHPCLNVLGFTTPAVLGRSMRGHDVSTGELPRFLVVRGRNDAEQRRVNEKLRLPEEVRKAINHMRVAEGFAQKDAEGSIPIKADAEASRLLDRAMARYDDPPAGVSSFAKELWTRAYEKVERIAMTLAVWACPTLPTIEPAMVEWAVAFVDYSNWSVIEFAERHMVSARSIGDANDVMDRARELMALKGKVITRNENEKRILQMGLVPWSILLKRSKLTANDFKDAVNYLVQTGQLEMVGVPFQTKMFNVPKVAQAVKVL